MNFSAFILFEAGALAAVYAFARVVGIDSAFSVAASIMTITNCALVIIGAR